MLLALVMTFAACGEEEETTLTGMVTAVDGTVISLMEMDGSMGSMDFAGGEQPQLPEGMEGFGGFDPGEFGGTLPEGETFPQWGEGEMPGGMMPPDGMTMPENGEMPDFGGQNGGTWPAGGDWSGDMETTDVDIGSAHISVEIDGGKASGSMEDIVPGAFVTITMNSKGEATYVLVSSRSSFGGGSRVPIS